MSLLHGNWNVIWRFCLGAVAPRMRRISSFEFSIPSSALDAPVLFGGLRASKLCILAGWCRVDLAVMYTKSVDWFHFNHLFFTIRTLLSFCSMHWFPFFTFPSCCIGGSGRTCLLLEFLRAENTATALFSRIVVGFRLLSGG